jgi:phage terminase large subunit-like protein
MMGERLNSGWAEWSVEKQTDPHDREAWYIANPSLGLIFTERSVADEIGSDDIDFNIQRLGLWIKYNQKSAISRAEWESLQIDGKPDITGKLYVGIRYGIDSVNVAVAIAAKTMDDKIFTEVIDCRPMRNGNDWILEFLSKADVAGVVIDGACGQGLLEKEMRNEHLKPPVLPKVKEVIRANSTFEMLLTQGRICHADQPSLTQVVANCEKRPIGSSGGFGYKSQIDDYEIVLLDSVILASWMASEAREHKKQRVNY